jgi:DNA-binding protein HU-beta
MRKIEIVTNVYRKTGLSRQDTSTTIEIFLKEIESSLKAGKSIYIRGFGTFMLKKRAKKTGRIILKNESVEIPEHYMPFFKPSKRFKQIVAKQKENSI